MEIELDQNLDFNNFNSNRFNLNNIKTNNSIIEDEPLLSTEENYSFPFCVKNNCNNTYSDSDNRKKSPKFNYKKVLSEKKPSTIISSSEGRLIKDMEELKNNKEIGRHCDVIINNYKRIKDTDNFQMIVEFKNYFSIQFIFYPDYPFSPPTISYYSGKKTPYIFDEDGNVLLDNAKKSKWTPALYVSHFVISIELLIAKGLNNNEEDSNLTKYTKRKWNDYLREEKKIFNNDESVIKELYSNIKQVKS
jgi:ubiquitin-protein ligase